MTTPGTAVYSKRTGSLPVQRGFGKWNRLWLSSCSGRGDRVQLLVAANHLRWAYLLARSRFFRRHWRRLFDGVATIGRYAPAIKSFIFYRIQNFSRIPCDSVRQSATVF
jgi:hypothetical protein